MSFSCGNTRKVDDNLILYEKALAIVCDTAHEHASRWRHNSSTSSRKRTKTPLVDLDRIASGPTKVALINALDSRCATAVLAPRSTPQHDTSAMDGYAVCSSSTLTASDDKPLLLRVVDYIAAGDTARLKHQDDTNFQEATTVCVEIMTGARFPETSFPFLDSVVKVEDVSLGEDWSDNGSMVSRHILLRKPVSPCQHRRPAGSDIRKGAVIVEEGEVIRPKHIAALASLGVVDIEISDVPNLTMEAHSGSAFSRPPRIGFLSTGSEIVDASQRDVVASREKLDKQSIPDSNGPYMLSNLSTLCPWAEVMHLGIAEDNEDALTQKLTAAISRNDLDVIITSGGVSRGRYDLVRDVVETRLKGRVRFHGAKIRPGAPVLFGEVDVEVAGRTSQSDRPIAFFGAPGNPLAAAVALRFFVLPYVLSFNPWLERGHHATLKTFNSGDSHHSTSSTCGYSVRQVQLDSCRRKPRELTVFWLAKHSSDDAQTVTILADQASYKLSGILKADCWVVVPAGVDEVCSGDQLMMCSL